MRIIAMKPADQFPGTVFRAVIDWNDAKTIGRIIDINEGAQRIRNNGFFVVSGDQNRNARPVCHVDIEVWMSLFSEQSIQGENQVPDHENPQDQDDDRQRNFRHQQRSCRSDCSGSGRAGRRQHQRAAVQRDARYAEKETDPRCETAIVRTTCHCHLSNAVPSSYPSHKSQSP